MHYGKANFILWAEGVSEGVIARAAPLLVRLLVGASCELLGEGGFGKGDWIERIREGAGPEPWLQRPFWKQGSSLGLDRDFRQDTWLTRVGWV